MRLDRRRNERLSGFKRPTEAKLRRHIKSSDGAYAATCLCSLLFFLTDAVSEGLDEVAHLWLG